MNSAGAPEGYRVCNPPRIDSSYNPRTLSFNKIGLSSNKNGEFSCDEFILIEIRTRYEEKS